MHGAGQGKLEFTSERASAGRREGGVTPREGVMRKKLETEIWLGSEQGRREGRKQQSIPLWYRANYRLKPTPTHTSLFRVSP